MQEDLEDTSEGGRQTLGLATARDLALRRDVCRGQLVGVLLAATEAEAEGLRTNGRFHGHAATHGHVLTRSHGHGHTAHGHAVTVTATR